MAKKIIVIDAEPIVRTVIGRILERAGYEVSAAENLPTALVLCRDVQPSLVLTNVYLPGITGHEALRLIKTECPAVPVLMVSGLPDSSVIRHWIDEDGFDVFPKPFTPDQLIAKVNGILGSKREGNPGGIASALASDNSE